MLIFLSFLLSICWWISPVYDYALGMTVIGSSVLRSWWNTGKKFQQCQIKNDLTARMLIRTLGVVLGVLFRQFFGSLYKCLARGARAVLQIYPENAPQLEMISAAALRCGFSGGLVVDYPHRWAVVCLCLFCLLLFTVSSMYSLLLVILFLLDLWIQFLGMLW